jgi:hypothetical protein
MNNALAIVNGNEWSAMVQVAEALVGSGFLPQSVNSAQKAVAIILAGRELGIGPWQALQTINVIQGKPTVSPQLMLALINASGQLEDIAIEGDAKGCIVSMKRKGRQVHVETFSFEDAVKLGLSKKDNYTKQPAIMLRWRAVAACARVVFPDVILGLYTPDEMGADVVTDDTGAMTVVTVEAQTVDTATGEITNGKPPIDLDKARQQLGNGGDRRIGQEAPAEADDDDDEPYLVSEIAFQKVSGQPNKLSCVLKAADGTNIVIYSSDPFRAAGFTDPQIKLWKDRGGWTFDTPLQVRASLRKNKTNDNLTWQDVTIDAGSEPATEADKQFASI